ncbi:MAG: flagellar biosynthesis protein FliQ [Gammaproteobacteria bacterium]|nr:flagellar biosynthesis protein FliQ [Gammaproteobacteria bacterium]
MTPETVITIGQQALWVTMLIASPMLLSALAVGLLVGMFQAATQINEMTMSFIPKLLVLVLALVVAGPWMLSVIVNYTKQLMGQIPSLIS